MKKILLPVLIVSFSVFLFLYFEFPWIILKPVFHKEIINKYSKQYSLDPLWVTSIIKEESKFLKKARSHKGAIGLMQVLPSTAEELASELGYTNFSALSLEDPDINIHLGTYYLSKLLSDFKGNELLALSAYNAGKTNVENWYKKDPLVAVDLSHIPYPETKKYVESVQRTYNYLKWTQELREILRKKKA